MAARAAQLHEREVERCVSTGAFEAIVEADVEWVWRHRFRRVVPSDDGAPIAEASFAALAQQSELDLLLGDYLNRWPKQEAELDLKYDVSLDLKSG